MNELSIIIREYFDRQKEIFERFGYKGVGMPISDLRHANWIKEMNRVHWSDKPLTPEAISSGTNLYGAEFSGEWHADGLTMLRIDVQDGHGDVLALFDDAKKIKPDDAQLEALELW